MKYKQTITGFIEAMARLVEQRGSGHVVLISEGGEWGKIQLHQGDIYSIGLGKFAGTQVLPQLKAMHVIQYMFRPTKASDPAGGNSRPSVTDETAMDNQTFFRFFGRDAAQPSAAQRQPPRAAGTGTTTHRAKILVVDDSALARKIAVSVLLKEGYQTIEAGNGFEALGQLEIETPDLVVLDLIMPGIDGYQVIEMMKKNPAHSTIPIIILTSRDSLMDRLKGKMSASDAYVTKPITGESLLGAITKILG